MPLIPMVLLAAGALALDTSQFQLRLAPTGTATALEQKSSETNWIGGAAVPFFSVKRAGRWFGVTHVEAIPKPNHIRAEFGTSGIVAEFMIAARPRYVTIELASLHGDGVEAVQLAHLSTAKLAESGPLLGVRANNDYAVALIGLSDRVQVSVFEPSQISASVFGEFGMIGERVALVASSRAELVPTLRQLERENGLPSPTLDGHWAKQSYAARRGYLLTDLDEANADQTIRDAKLAEMGAIMIYAGTWAKSFGSYEINRRHYPSGEQGLGKVIAKCHAAGLKVGMHMLTSLIAKDDPLVRPKPDPRLLVDAEATLGEGLSPDATRIVAATRLSEFAREPAFYGGASQGMSVRIDDEIIEYSAVGGKNGTDLVRCRRGADGTMAASHAKGARVLHLAERYGSFLADLRTDLKSAISARIAGVVNRVGFDMIFFDGGEVNSANGPYWYWAGQQQSDVWRRVRRPVLVEGSGITTWTWHFFTRSMSDDFAAVATKQYLVQHKIAHYWDTARRSFLPSQLGWWGLLEDTPDHPASMPDEVEYYAAHMLALDAPVSLETTASQLLKNRRSHELLELLGRWERLRLSRALAVKQRIRLNHGEWHLVQRGGRLAVEPVTYSSRRLLIGGTTLSEASFLNSFSIQPLKFRLRVEPTLSPVGGSENVLLAARRGPPLLAPPDSHAAMPGTVAERIELQPLDQHVRSAYLIGPDEGESRPVSNTACDLRGRRALAVTLEVVGARLGPAQQPAVLNIQLEDSRKTYRDYEIDLDFIGTRTVILPTPTSERTVADFPPAPENYPLKASVYHFDFGRIVAVNVRWMRSPDHQAPQVRVRRIEALAELPASLDHPAIKIEGAGTVSIPTVLNTSEYAESWGDGSIRVFDRNGALLSTWPASEQELPRIPKGNFRVTLSETGTRAGAASFTLITTGSAESR